MLFTKLFFAFIPCQEKDPWLRIELEKPVFVFKIQLRNRQECCLNNLVDVRVFLGASGEKVPAVCKAYDRLEQTSNRLMLCEPSGLTSHVTIVAEGEKNVLQLCEVIIYASGE